MFTLPDAVISTNDIAQIRKLTERNASPQELEIDMSSALGHIFRTSSLRTAKEESASQDDSVYLNGRDLG
jgi:hypothetical protein